MAVDEGRAAGGRCHRCRRPSQGWVPGVEAIEARPTHPVEAATSLVYRVLRKVPVRPRPIRHPSTLGTWLSASVCSASSPAPTRPLICLTRFNSRRVHPSCTATHYDTHPCARPPLGSRGGREAGREAQFTDRGSERGSYGRGSERGEYAVSEAATDRSITASICSWKK